jgi:hypothetical protein
MDQKVKLILALQQIENVFELMKDNQYAGFISSHAIPLKFEIERQILLLTNTNK